VRQGGGADRVPDRLGAPGDAHIRMIVDDPADVLAHLGVGFDDENPEARAVG
jgi:hypothetical protein